MKLGQYTEAVSKTMYQDAQVTAAWFVTACQLWTKMSSYTLGAIVGGIGGSITAYRQNENLLQGLTIQAFKTSKDWANVAADFHLPKNIADKTGKVVGGTLGFFHGNGRLVINNCQRNRPAVDAQQEFATVSEDLQAMPVALRMRRQV